ncbi:hypothetical protein LJC07_06730 [Christensenellaceae bacterium OttesenSCG-928-L17]|nr:hypothetical protein [Christensenellaceae bacterium OttesenSCG-928-L17]
MVQHEQGLKSGCVCPDCLFRCADCMGTATPPAALDALEMEAALRARIRALENEETE